MENKNEIMTSRGGLSRVSVAMATYNGAKYIEEQLLSICRQTRRVDEIVISDDGSKDATLEIVDSIRNSEATAGIDFVVITDNPRHGYCGNFEWAIRHTTGDFIFLSDQDDVWEPVKVESMLGVFAKHPDAACVCHNATLINEKGIPIKGIFDERFSGGKLNVPKGQIAKIDRDTYLEPAVSWGGIHGMSMCISRKLAADIIPFPRSRGFHDKWITLCAVLDDAMYYLNLPLVMYRLHGSNTCGSSAYSGNFYDKLKRMWKRLFSGTGGYAMYYEMGKAIRGRLEEKGFSNHQANIIANRLVEIGEKTYSAETSGRITGAIKLCMLFCTDLRYRRSGTCAFLQELLYILRHSKKDRAKNTEGEIS